MCTNSIKKQTVLLLTNKKIVISFEVTHLHAQQALCAECVHLHLDRERERERDILKLHTLNGKKKISNRRIGLLTNKPRKRTNSVRGQKNNVSSQYIVEYESNSQHQQVSFICRCCFALLLFYCIVCVGSSPVSGKLKERSKFRRMSTMSLCLE